jgi:Uma2 family endonuclease
MEVYKMLPEGTLAELINGQIYMPPAPNTDQERASTKLLTKLVNFTEQRSLGEVFDSPYDVFLDEKANAVQPDIAFVAKANLAIVKSHGIVGVPDLLIEFLSPGNDKHDRVVKKDLYEKFGVKEYWIIDPLTKESIVYQWVEKRYVLSKKDKGKLFSPLFNHSFTI